MRLPLLPEGLFTDCVEAFFIERSEGLRCLCVVWIGTSLLKRKRDHRADGCRLAILLEGRVRPFLYGIDGCLLEYGDPLMTSSEGRVPREIFRFAGQRVPIH